MELLIGDVHWLQMAQFDQEKARGVPPADVNQSWLLNDFGSLLSLMIISHLDWQAAALSEVPRCSEHGELGQLRANKDNGRFLKKGTSAI